MNKKAESFKKYLEDNKIEVFQVEEAKDEINSVAFRSQIDVDGQMLPAVLITDDTVFTFIRVLVAPKANSKNEKSNLYKTLNDLSAKYKPFKFYVTEDDALVLDCSLLTVGDELNGDLVYGMFELMIKHLTEGDYKAIMKEVWL